MNKDSMMEQALQIRDCEGSRSAIDFLVRHGFSYELSVIAIVGMNPGNRNYGIPSPKESI